MKAELSKKYSEIEAKFFPVDKEKIRATLKKSGYKLEKPERMMRRAIFDDIDNPEMTAHYIRVRDEGDGVYRLSAKIHVGEDGDISGNREVDVTLSNYDDAIEILRLAGLKGEKYQETLRETWVAERDGEEVEVTINTWPMLEPLVEIETKSEDVLRKCAKELGFDWDKKIVTAIVEVYMKVYGWSQEEALDKIQNIKLSK